MAKSSKLIKDTSTTLIKQNIDEYALEQISIVEFSARVYHARLRHKGLNGSLYEDKFIYSLRKMIPELSFYKGQIRQNEEFSSQMDVIICKKSTKQPDFLKDVTDIINIVPAEDCIGVIELKKWGNPSMIAANGSIASSYEKFKSSFPKLKYYFVCLRFKDRVRAVHNNWHPLIPFLKTDGNYCFFGRIAHEEWHDQPWAERKEILYTHDKYLGEYKQLINDIKKLTAK